MIHASEQEEREYLSQVVELLRETLAEAERQVLDYAEGLVETKREAWRNQGNLDKVEQAAYRIAVTEESYFAELSVSQRSRLRKLLASPYFGRVDFVVGDGETAAHYIGIHSFSHEGREVIVDWRAPLSNIFYDFETGPASYRSPAGEVTGTITVKRQYRIRDSQMEYLLESALNIGDDILQQELSRASDDKMKNIVATIQKEQNQIIRNDTAKVLIIQGAAGSGKTSIALHRMAFLLYRHKQTLKADDVLVLSPNKVFGSYIGNVLPELGEENIPQLGFEDLARQFLKRRKFQTFGEQVADLTQQMDEAKVERIRYKATNQFVEELAAFLRESDENEFHPESFQIEFFSITAEELLEEYRRLRAMPVRARLEKMAADSIAAYNRVRGSIQPLSTAAKRQIKERIRRMFPHKDALGLYRQFYRRPGREGLFQTLEKGKLEFCDVFPLAWLTLQFEGVPHRYGEIKHLLVDEMQDYTPIQYAFVAELFSCRMTILGDSLQSVNPYTSTSMETIAPYFPGAEQVELLKSYRSTLEIVNFAQTIRRNPHIVPMDRHGQEPTLTGCGNMDGEITYIAARIKAFRQSAYHSLGIVCKSQAQAELLYKSLQKDCGPLTLLDFDSEEFGNGVVITSCHMAKGLEFDWAIVPDCSANGYRTELDRSLLYIACTRAMHVLELSFHGEQSSLIAPGTIWYLQGESE